ncbi:CGNR zinc finger domain-containing protein [Klenkia marina]|uniref:CGNR zinc finger domain-containing protein n=1 Tax=Klenkia marina TaxID=1960309 RepID=A0A1G4XS10_9ACTN|nr:CGNR zinc finger domain-containing protein [Klenkia marina]SCX43947.1 CGNR zinc finger domain-containing protein [Klenkia marina]
MLFAHDTEVGLQAAAGLVNTASGSGTGTELLPDPPALAAFLDTWGFTGHRAGDDAELAAVHRLRARLAEMWDDDTDGVVAVVNRLLRDGDAQPQLVRHDDWGWHVHATEPHAPLAHRMAVEAAMAVADLVRAEELDRLSRCEAEGCGAALVDLTKNRSRRFCDTACANRTHAAAYRARRAAARG